MMECLVNLPIGLGYSQGKCLSREMTVANLILAALNGLIAVVAFIQLLRLHLYSLPLRWTREKVFHCLIGVATLGYFVCFLLNVIAACKGWDCWKHACGFLAMAFPQIIFLATFLLLLSFWVDLCHQATDQEDEEDDDEIEEDEEEPSISSEDAIKDVNGSSLPDRQHRKCCYWWRFRIHGRQKFVIAVVMFIFCITIAFAILIWVGMGKNPIDSATVAEIYSDLFALVIFLSGGGLAGYGLALYTRMKKLKVGKTSTDLQKVAGLAVASVICFSIRALFVLLGDIDIKVLNIRSKHAIMAFFLYSLIGEVIPCLVVLWVLRNNSSRSSASHNPRSSHLIDPIYGYQEVLAQEQALLDQLLIPEDLESIVVISKQRRTDLEEGGSTSNSASG